MLLCAEIKQKSAENYKRIDRKSTKLARRKWRDYSRILCVCNIQSSNEGMKQYCSLNIKKEVFNQRGSHTSQSYSECLVFFLYILLTLCVWEIIWMQKCTVCFYSHHGSHHICTYIPVLLFFQKSSESRKESFGHEVEI